MDLIFLYLPISPLALAQHLLATTGLVALAAVVTRFMLHRVRIMDLPNERSSHTRPVPRSGGIAIVATFFAGILAIYLFAESAPITQQYYWGFMLSALAIAAVSLYDDLTGASFMTRLLVQIAATAVVLAFGIVIDTISIPWWGPAETGWLAYPLTLLWIVGMTNAFNFMDGLDGLAAGSAAIASFFFALITLSQASTFVYITSYTVLAGALGFLVYNFPPARIFMGDVGSAFLGFVLAVLAVMAARYDQSHTSFLVMPLLLLHFIFDTAFTFFRRLIAGEKVTEAHRTHIYQLLNRLGWSHRKVALLYYGMGIAQGFGAVWMVQIPGDTRVLVFLPFLLLHLVVVVTVIRKARNLGLIA